MLEYSGNHFFCEMSSLLCCPLADLHIPNLHLLHSGAILRGSVEAVHIEKASFLKDVLLFKGMF